MPATVSVMTVSGVPGRSAATICCVRLPWAPAFSIAATASRTRGPSRRARASVAGCGCGAKIVRDELTMLPGQRGSCLALAGCSVQPPSCIQRGAAPVSGRPNQRWHSAASTFSLKVTRSIAKRGGADGTWPGRGCGSWAMRASTVCTIGSACSKACCSLTLATMRLTIGATAWYSGVHQS